MVRVIKGKKQVALVISNKHAKVLTCLTGSVIGSSTITYRKETDEMFNALNDAIGDVDDYFIGEIEAKKRSR